MAKKIKGEDPETMNENNENLEESNDAVVEPKVPAPVKKEEVIQVSEPLKVMEHLEEDKDFRCRTPIPEDPNEERTISPEIKDTDVFSDDPKPSTSSDSPEVLHTQTISPKSTVSRAASPVGDISRAASPVGDISRAASPVCDISHAAVGDISRAASTEPAPKTDELLVTTESVPSVSRSASPDIPEKPKESLAVPLVPILPLSPGKSKATGRKIAGWL